MLLVVIGAGASYDSCPAFPPIGEAAKHEARPPLACNLFDTREAFQASLERFYQCQPIVPHLRHEGTNVEDKLRYYQADAQKHPKRHGQLAAVRFHLRTSLWALEEQWYKVHRGVTNYKTLLDHLERWNRETNQAVCIVTFNYDKMLENVFPSIGIKIQEMSDYIVHQSFKLIKLHGSVDWGHIIEPGLLFEGNREQMINEMIQKAEHLPLSKEFVQLKHQNHVELPAGDGLKRGIYPAITVPTTEKQTFECPQQHQEALWSFAPHVTKIVTVGWKGGEQYFLKLLASYSQKVRSILTVTGEKDARDTENALRSVGICDSVTAFPGGFTRSIVDGVIETFLYRAT